MSVYMSSDHQTRELLLENIKDRPGISFSKLMRLLNINEGTLRYHLNYLERKELITSKKEGAKRLYFNSLSSAYGGEGRDDLTRDQTRVYNIIRKYPGIKPKEILDRSELSRKGLRNILQKLQNEHLIWEVENGNGAGYEIVTRKRLMEEMLLDLAEKFLKGDIDRPTFLHLKDWIEEAQENN